MAHRKSIFFTSDWHLLHANSIRFDNRPFTDVDHMSRVLINNYNSSVPKNGICYFLGDMGLGQSGAIKDLITQLNGTRILIAGNHDGGVQAMYNCGFDAVLCSASILIAGEVVTMSHHPLPGIVREDTSDMKGSLLGEVYHGALRPNAKLYSVPSIGQFHLHGHIHSPNGGKSTKILDKQMDVGVVANKYRPIHISAIESWIGTYGRAT